MVTPGVDAMVGHRHILVAVLIGLSGFALCSTLPAQETASPPAEQPAATASDAGKHDAAAEAQRRRQKRRVTIGLVVVALVTASGAGLVIFTILGGTAARRGIRTPSAEGERFPPPGNAAMGVPPVPPPVENEGESSNVPSPGDGAAE